MTQDQRPAMYEWRCKCGVEFADSNLLGLLWRVLSHVDRFGCERDAMAGVRHAV